MHAERGVRHAQKSRKTTREIGEISDFIRNQSLKQRNQKSIVEIRNQGEKPGKLSEITSEIIW